MGQPCPDYRSDHSKTTSVDCSPSQLALVDARKTKPSDENGSYSSTLEGTCPPPGVGVALDYNFIEPRCEDEINRQVSSQTMKPLLRFTNISNVPCERLKQYGHFHRQISAYAWKPLLSIMLEHIGIVRSLWVELNGSIKAVSSTYRCATYSHHESELPLCGRIDFTKPEKSSLISIIARDPAGLRRGWLPPRRKRCKHFFF